MSFSAESEGQRVKMIDIVSTNIVKRLPIFLQMIQSVCMLNINVFFATTHPL